MQQYLSDDFIRVEQQQSEASRFTMKTLGILLVLALVIGWMTGEFGLAIYGAFMAWIPAVLLFGGIAEKVKAGRVVRHG